MKTLKTGKLYTDYEQDSYNCGLYSLQIAMDSLDTPAKPIDIQIGDLKNASLCVPNNWGGLFSCADLLKVVTEFNKHSTLHFKAEIKNFTTELDLKTLLQNSPISEAILIGYCFGYFAHDLVFKKILSDADSLSVINKTLLTLSPIQMQEIASNAHWSVIVGFDHSKKEVTIANPHGKEDKGNLTRLFEANLLLDSKTFNTADFFKKARAGRQKYKFLSSQGFKGWLPPSKPLKLTTTDFIDGTPVPALPISLSDQKILYKSSKIDILCQDAYKIAKDFYGKPGPSGAIPLPFNSLKSSVPTSLDLSQQLIVLSVLP